MSIPLTPAVGYRGSLMADAKPLGKPRFIYPLPQESPIQLAAYAFDQEFQMALSGFPPAQKNTPSNAVSGGNSVFSLSDANAILTALTQPANMGAAVGKFSARFNRVPASWDDYKTLPYTYPGWIGLIGSSAARNINPVKVTTRLHYDYFLADPTNLAAGILDSGGNAVSIYTAASLIPIIQKTYFCWTNAGAPVLSAHTNSLVTSGNQTIGSVTYVATFPTIQTYQTWVTNAAASGVNGGWGTTVWNGTDLTQSNVGQIVADDSYLQPYAGNIWARVTPYILVR